MPVKHVVQLLVVIGALALFFLITLITGNGLEAAAIAVGGALIVTAFLNRPTSQ